MNSIISNLAESLGIGPDVAKFAIDTTTKIFLQKSTPKAASGLLHSLPKNITDQFDDNQRRAFTTTQEEITRDDLLRKLSQVTGIKDIDKLAELADQALDALRQNANTNGKTDDDREELFAAIKDLYRGKSHIF